MNKVVQVVPYLPPSISGVGDYALILARGLRDTHGWHTTFAVAYPNEGQSDIEGFPVISLGAHTGRTLCSMIAGQDRVLLHYVGYGYQKRGCPLWLLRGLRRWKIDGDGDRRLVTMFHELYASGPPWRSSFWTCFVQRWICRQIALLSSDCATNRISSARKLRRFRGGGAVGLLPVFSNVGEPAQCLPGEQRASQLAIFGSEEWRRLAVSRDLDALAAACRALAIDQIVDIGPGSIPHPDLPDIQWIVTGPLPAKEVSRWLARCRAGFSSYPSHCFGKSGIIAAYMAHGLPLVVPRHSIRREVDTLELGSHYLVAEEIGNDGICVAAKMVTECFRWHQGHRIDHQVSKFADQLNAAYD